MAFVDSASLLKEAPDLAKLVVLGKPLDATTIAFRDARRWKETGMTEEADVDSLNEIVAKII
jgi:hypothetical protein